MKNGLSKKYNTVEDVLMPQIFNFRGVDYIFMRKALYGYCIIDSRNFDEYNYFPSAVIEDGEEAFICCKVHSLKDLLIIEGCYWAAPYEIFALDPDSKKCVRLNSYLGFAEFEGVGSGDDPIKLYEHGFGVTDGDGNKEYFIDCDEIKKYISEHGTFDL